MFAKCRNYDKHATVHQMVKSRKVSNKLSYERFFVR